MKGLLTDSGFSIGSYYSFLEHRKITGWVPVFGKYKFEIEGFNIIKKRRILLPKIAYNTGCMVQKIYRTTTKDCKACPTKSTGVPNKGLRQISRTFMMSSIFALTADNIVKEAYNEEATAKHNRTCIW